MSELETKIELCRTGDGALSGLLLVVAPAGWRRLAGRGWEEELMLAALTPMPAQMILQSQRFDALMASQQAEAKAFGMDKSYGAEIGLQGLRGLSFGLGTDLSTDGSWPPECDPFLSTGSGECVPWSYAGTVPPIRTITGPSGIMTPRPGFSAPGMVQPSLIPGIPNSYLVVAAAGLVGLIIIGRMS